MPYRYAVGEDAVQAFATLPTKRRRKVMRVCEHLARYPKTSGDFHETGTSGRVYALKLFDDILFTWWVDHAAREVMVLRLELMD